MMKFLIKLIFSEFRAGSFGPLIKKEYRNLKKGFQKIFRNQSKKGQLKFEECKISNVSSYYKINLSRKLPGKKLKFLKNSSKETSNSIIFFPLILLFVFSIVFKLPPFHLLESMENFRL